MYQYPKQILTIAQQVQSYIDAGMVRRARASMKNFDNFNLSVPKWYSSTLGKYKNLLWGGDRIVYK